MESQLSPLQFRILRLLAGFEPRWTLTGGGALCGFYFGHRTTRDLELFFHGLKVLDTIPLEIEGFLVADGLAVATERSAPGYRRFVVQAADERTIIDLVAEPVPGIEAPVELEPGIFVDTRHEIMVNKLNALLGRTALRDLIDVGALWDSGGDLDRALGDAAQKDGGFSPQRSPGCWTNFRLIRLHGRTISTRCRWSSCGIDWSNACSRRSVPLRRCAGALFPNRKWIVRENAIVGCGQVRTLR